jgi:adenylyltransferase/sulfurtransferase
MSSAISPDDRYSRQVLFKPFGPEGQRKTGTASVVIVGCGATGSAVAALLARAGVGRLRIVDRDFVEPSNLQRQNLFDEQDAAQFTPKAIAAQRKISLFNSDIAVEAFVSDLTPANAADLLNGFDLILDATDNFETRYLINDFAVSSGTPWIYAAVVGAYGVTMNILPGETSCLSCIFPAQPQGIVETCDTAGILNSAVNLIASIEATEALKFLSGNRRAMRLTMLSWDLWRNESSEISTAEPRTDCQTCQAREFPHLAGEGRPQITLCGRNSVQIHERRKEVSFAEMRDRLAPHGTVRSNDFVLKFSRDPYEITLFPDGRAIIKGTTDTAVARSLYARYIGS